MTKALVTGAGGYIGSVLTRQLLDRDWEVTAFDRFFFGTDILGDEVTRQASLAIKMADIRDCTESDFAGIEVVFDLAGLSNDATSELDPVWTYEINLQGSLRVARAAKAAGVSRYVFASSSALYGDSGAEPVNEESPIHPLTPYAKAKAEAEPELLAMTDANFSVTCLRNATVYGLSPRMRFDLVINVMVLFAWREGRIMIREGGKQWRPFLSVEDVADAMITVAEATDSLVSGEIFNVGSAEQNLRIDRLAFLVSRSLEEFGGPIGIEEIPEDPDRRTYRVDFSKINRVLGWRPKVEIQSAVQEIWKALEERRLDSTDPRWITVSYYRYLLDCERLMQQIGRNGRVF